MSFQRVDPKLRRRQAAERRKQRDQNIDQGVKVTSERSSSSLDIVPTPLMSWNTFEKLSTIVLLLFTGFFLALVSKRPIIKPIRKNSCVLVSRTDSML